MKTVAASWMCDHSQMTECCDGCGHFSCPCGIYWDEGAEGPGPFDGLNYALDPEAKEWMLSRVDP